MIPEERIRGLLSFLYPPEQAQAAWNEIRALIEGFRAPVRPARGELSEKDALLITYGDSFRRVGEAPLRTLDAFLRGEDVGLAGVGGPLSSSPLPGGPPPGGPLPGGPLPGGPPPGGPLLSGVHILPFYPYSSDDGFSVIDYRAVDPRLGDWPDIARIGGHARMMFDGVINHISAHSEWFKGFKEGREPYTGYFIVPGADWDLSRVVRPRTLPLLTEVETTRGPLKVWTTFSADQIDLNYANPRVLVEIVDLLLFYVQQGAGLIRLDAIAYLWKEPGTTCLHLPQTHAVIKLLRAVLDATAPHVLLITETNVPHHENISYFGEVDPSTGRTDEAQLVYQFPLAPLVLHSFRTGSAETLSAWAASLEGGPGLFFNFIASHDGIGLSPAQGILTPAEIGALVEQAQRHGGRVSYRSNPDGTQSPYELNVTLYDALNDPAAPSPLDTPRFLAAQAILLSLAGLPGIYVHSLFGSRNWQEGVQQTGRARTINRAWFDYPTLLAQLADPSTREAQVFRATMRLLALRRAHPAFHPRGPQRVLNAGPGVFALERTSPDGGERVLCLVNVTAQRQPVRVQGRSWQDLISGEMVEGQCELPAYQVMWLAVNE